MDYDGTMYLWYANNKLNRLAEVKNDNDDLVVARIALWRLMKNAHLYVLDGYNKGKGVALTKHESTNASVQDADNGDIYNT